MPALLLLPAAPRPAAAAASASCRCCCSSCRRWAASLSRSCTVCSFSAWPSCTAGSGARRPGEGQQGRQEPNARKDLPFRCSPCASAICIRPCTRCCRALHARLHPAGTQPCACKLHREGHTHLSPTFPAPHPVLLLLCARHDPTAAGGGAHASVAQLHVTLGEQRSVAARFWGRKALVTRRCKWLPLAELLLCHWAADANDTTKPVHVDAAQWAPASTAAATLTSGMLAPSDRIGPTSAPLPLLARHQLVHLTEAHGQHGGGLVDHFARVVAPASGWGGERSRHRGAAVH